MTEGITLKSDHWLRSPHDKFGRNFLQRKAIASDLLLCYGDPVIAENVDLDDLQPAPTHGISKALKEIVMDVSYLARLRDGKAKSEVLFVLEHKSRPSPMVALQVGLRRFWPCIPPGQTPITAILQLSSCRSRLWSYCITVPRIGRKRRFGSRIYLKTAFRRYRI